MHFADLTSVRVGELLAEAAPLVLLLPTGAVEPHGPHAALATDSIISMAVCESAARELASSGPFRALVLPAIDYGVTRYSAAFPGAVTIAEATLSALVSDICSALEGGGFHHRVIVNSHFEPEHVATLRRVASATGTGFFDVTRRRLAEQLTDEFRSGAAHAGSYETSMVLARRPDLVDRSRMEQLPEIAVDMPAAIAAGKTDFLAMGMEHAYCGAPARATATEGESTLATLVRMLIEHMHEQIGG